MILEDKNIDQAILIAEPDDSSMGYYAIMEMYSLLPKNSPIIVRRGLSSDLTDILRYSSISDISPRHLAFEKKNSIQDSLSCPTHL